MVNFRRIPSIFVTRPMAFVFRYFLKKPFTIHDGDLRNKNTIYYPEELAKKDQTVLDVDLSLSDVYKNTPHISPNFRGLLTLNIMKCTGCKACARVCPNKCIEMVLADPQPNHWKKKRELLHPEMFVGRCMYCGLCEAACPYDCLFHAAGFDAAATRLEDLHHSYRDLYELYKLYFPERYKKELEEYIEEWGKPVEENFGPVEENTKKSIEEGVTVNSEAMED